MSKICSYADKSIVGNIQSKNLFNQEFYKNLNEIVALDTSGEAGGYFIVPIFTGKPNTSYYLKTEYLNGYTSIGVAIFVLMYPNNVDGGWLSIAHGFLGIKNGILVSDNNGYITLQVSKDVSASNYNNLMNNCRIQIEEQIEGISTPTVYTPFKGFGYTSGSNENGSWVKYDDGRLECTNSFIEIPANTDNKLITFPQQFINRDISLALTPFYSYYLSAILTPSKPQTGNFNVYPRTHAGVVPNVITTFAYIAIGRWKE